MRGPALLGEQNTRHESVRRLPELNGLSSSSPPADVERQRGLEKFTPSQTKSRTPRRVFSVRSFGYLTTVSNSGTASAGCCLL
jgi:hypothetical protein